jgi:hypothetical protein
MLTRLRLPTIRRLSPDLVLRAEVEGMSYRDFLHVLCSEEIADRVQPRITRCVRRGGSYRPRSHKEEVNPPDEEAA